MNIEITFELRAANLCPCRTRKNSRRELSDPTKSDQSGTKSDIYLHGLQPMLLRELRNLKMVQVSYEIPRCNIVIHY